MKLAIFNPRLITKKFFPKEKATDINGGRCFIWAYLTFKSFRDVKLMSYGSHAFVKYNDKFYDSETPNGVSDWKDLPASNGGNGCGRNFCNDCQKNPIQCSIKKFQHEWRGAKKRYSVDWEKLDNQAYEFIKTFS